MRRILRALDGATQAANVAGSLLILVLMALVGLDVAGRNLFGAPVPGVPEMVTLSIVAIVFLQIPQALRAGRMTRSEAVPGWLSRRAPWAGRMLETLFDLLAIAVVWVILRSTWPIFTRAWDRGEFIGALGDFTVPVWPVKATILLGCALLIAQFAARILRRWAGGAA
ncbi:TRAP-type mannitol/chloroaromatic compound transport system, small permease component [Lutimaribacter pacificus]|uniref:TRAP transporter small permease protein n=1 Tax=Lutimaribacter pacificus TaxID=391948 RepID=A0A1H0CTY1_9RHOB|nr:TRAP transporter small permease subunit [Lutimaribacter pacificus]SDN61334.1 TRAP-type mannitol/chloroaromatic compound transport system, small permease component [Lutimaribacter pacificus]SHJ40727.1 TRAP-type mannitol/chloroaromatic compound transport system, small permease component [Lutimaribacter pacificus]